jgi:hypothetical protein
MATGYDVTIPKIGDIFAWNTSTIPHLNPSREPTSCQEKFGPGRRLAKKERGPMRTTTKFTISFDPFTFGRAS